jgi:hypothetical protein
MGDPCLLNSSRSLSEPTKIRLNSNLIFNIKTQQEGNMYTIGEKFFRFKLTIKMVIR